MEENKETEEQRSKGEERSVCVCVKERERERERELGGKETYITACAVRTFVEEFGRRLRSP